MKNTFKKVLCTTLAAVSLSAAVTVPSSLNKPNSDNSFVNVIEANAKDIVYKDLSLAYKQGETTVTFELTVDKLNARSWPDGPKVATFSKSNGRGYNIHFSKIRIEKYGTENRVWGLTDNEIKCDDGVYRNVWLCIYRGIKNGNIYEPKKQIECENDDYKTKLNSYFQTGATNPGFYLTKENIYKSTLHCYKKNGKHYVDLES